jgi:hypothetical protein
VHEFFELHARGIGVDPLGQFPLLHASLDVPSESSNIINAKEFALDTNCEM